MPDTEVPTYYDLIWPMLTAALRLGGSAGKDELDGEVIEHESFTDAQQQVLKGDGPQTLLLDRMSWARSYLKGMGLMDNPRRAVWSVTERGQAVEEKDIHSLHAEYLAASKARTQAKRQSVTASGAAADQTTSTVTTPPPDELTTDLDVQAEGDFSGAVGWKDVLLDRLLVMDPKAFEHLAQRILREAGFSRVNVTGRSNDGGIDGLGVYKVSLLSFPVYFQCKRYKGSVGSSTIRDFRGAMAGRGDKGLLITTGSFTSEAQKEAKRDGAQPVDLIDGDALCDLLRELSLGVKTVERVVEDVTVVPDFFDALDEQYGPRSQQA